MTVDGLVLVRVQPGQAYTVAEDLRKHRPAMMEKVYVIAGPYDVVVILSAQNVVEIGKFVVDRIQKLEGVIQTLTMVSVDAIEGEISDVGEAGSFS